MFTLSDEAQNELNQAQDFIFDSLRKGLTSCLEQYKLRDIDLAYLIDSMTQNIRQDILSFILTLNNSSKPETSVETEEPQVEEVKVEEPKVTPLNLVKPVVHNFSDKEQIAPQTLMEKCNFGKTLKKIRQNKKISKDQLSKLAEIPHQTISLYENNNWFPNLAYLTRLSYRLSTTPNALLNINSKDFPIYEFGQYCIDTPYYGNRWKMIRESRGMSMKKMARVMSVAASIIEKYETYTKYELKDMSVEQLFRYCSALEVTPDVFLSFSSKNNK